MSQWADAFKAWATVQIQISKTGLGCERGRHLRAGRPINGNKWGIDGCCDVHQARVIADGLLAARQQINDIGE